MLATCFTLFSPQSSSQPSPALSAHLAALCAPLHQPLPQADADGVYSIVFPEQCTLYCAKDGSQVRMEMPLLSLPSPSAVREKMCRTVLECSAARLSGEYRGPLLIPCLCAEEIRLRLRLPLSVDSEVFLEQCLRLYDASLLWRKQLREQESPFFEYQKSNIPLVIFG